MGRSIVISLKGKAVPQGSMVAYGRKIAASNASELALFRDRVAVAAEREWGKDKVSLAGFSVVIHFNFARPAGHYRTGKNAGILKDSAPMFHVKRPDIDKLARSVLDSLTHIVYKDDSQVFRLQLDKQYIDDGKGEGLEVYVTERA